MSSEQHEGIHLLTSHQLHLEEEISVLMNLLAPIKHIITIPNSANIQQLFTCSDLIIGNYSTKKLLEDLSARISFVRNTV